MAGSSPASLRSCSPLLSAARGLRSSWLRTARKWSLVRTAACSRALSDSAAAASSCCRVAETSSASFIATACRRKIAVSVASVTWIMTPAGCSSVPEDRPHRVRPVNGSRVASGGVPARPGSRGCRCGRRGRAAPGSRSRPPPARPRRRAGRRVPPLPPDEAGEGGVEVDARRASSPRRRPSAGATARTGSGRVADRWSGSAPTASTSSSASMAHPYSFRSGVPGAVFAVPDSGVERFGDAGDAGRDSPSAARRSATPPT